MSWESQPKITNCVGGQEGNGGASRFGTIGFYLCLGGERLQKATNTDLTDPRYRDVSSESLPTDALFPHNYTLTNEYLRPHLTSQECGLIPALSTTELSEPCFSPRNGITPATVPCNRERERQSDSGPSPTISYAADSPSLPTSAHRCQRTWGDRVKFNSGHTALLLSHRHTQLVLCPPTPETVPPDSNFVNIHSESLDNQTGLI